jgi:5-methylcytosine-specific restriction endonuclease McrA
MFEFLETVELDPGWVHTPLNQEAPMAPAILIHYGRIPMWKVVRCPYCGHSHEHSAGENGDDPRRHLGGRVAHCHPVSACDEYRLIAISGKPTKAEIDAHFPMTPTRSRFDNVRIVGLPSSPTQEARERRAQVWDKTDGRCWYCGLVLHPFRTFQVDHVVPRADDGPDDLENLVPACSTCNARKSHRPVDYLRQFMPDGVFWAEREGFA